MWRDRCGPAEDIDATAKWATKNCLEMRMKAGVRVGVEKTAEGRCPLARARCSTFVLIIVLSLVVVLVLVLRAAIRSIFFCWGWSVVVGSLLCGGGLHVLRIQKKRVVLFCTNKSS